MTRISERMARALDASGLDITIDAHTVAAHGLDATEVLVGARETGPAPWASGIEFRTDSVQIEFVDVLGEGGMGVVHRGRQASIGRDVAVKELRPGLADQPGHASSLLREGLLTGRLEHPNIVPVHALNRGDDGSPRIVMKRIEGESWRARLRGVQRPIARTDALLDELEVFVAVCRAIEYAHSRGTVHRDIKPANVMVGHFGEVYVVDWGIAVHEGPVQADVGDANVSVEVSGVDGFVGTPVYMAPEMLEGDVSWIDARTDVYLLGATLYEVLTGAAPHAGTEGLMELVSRVANSKACEVPAEADVHEELASIVARATARDPNDRYSDVGALRRAVADYVRHHSSLALTDRADDAAVGFERVLGEVGDATEEAERRQAFEAFSEVQLGYRAALFDWPENPRAREGLDAVSQRMCRWALATEQPEFATSLADQMATVPNDLVAEIEAARAAVDARRQASAALNALRQERSFSRSGTSQAKLLFGVLVLGSGVTAGLVWQANSLVLEVTHPLLIAIVTGLGGLVAGAAWVFRARLMASQISRELTLGMLSIFPLLLVHRLASWAAGTPPNVVMGRDLFIEAAVLVIGRITLGRYFAWPAVAALAMAVVATIWPPYAPLLFGLAQLVVPLIFVPAFLRRVRADRERFAGSRDD